MHAAWQPSPERGPLFEIAVVALDVRSSDGEQAKIVLVAPGDELAHVQGIRVAGQAAVAGKDRGKRVPLRIRESRVDDRDGSGRR